MATHFVQKPPMTSEQAAFVERAFARAKEEILADIASGVVPISICDYDDLCCYVTQPGDYGGLNDDAIEDEGAALFPPPDQLSGSHVGYVGARLEVSTRIHEWLRSRAEGLKDL